jgi:hypothetical protein
MGTPAQGEKERATGRYRIQYLLCTMPVLRSAGWGALPDQDWAGNSINQLDAQCPHSTDTGTNDTAAMGEAAVTTAAGSGGPSFIWSCSKPERREIALSKI